jgi:hypothetical protein
VRVPMVLLCLVGLIQSGCVTTALWDWREGPDVLVCATGLGTADEVEAVAADEWGRLLVAVSYTSGERFLALCPSVAPVGTEAPLVELINLPGEFNTTHAGTMTQEDFSSLARAAFPESDWDPVRVVGAEEPLGEESFRIRWGRLERRSPRGDYEVLCSLPGEAGGGYRPIQGQSSREALLRLIATPFALAIDAIGLPFFVARVLLGR